ncbi:MAG TPA: class I SAM-dependent methyltransferase [Polyangiaceae bacterium]|nr:class I SAM-dependent methyltransferase [Polyangiaceae bacterium]
MDAPEQKLQMELMPDFDHHEVTDHYQHLLAPLYAWMLGDLAEARRAARLELERLGVAHSTRPKRALDLGAGLGVHAVALAELGYQVTAIDSSPELLSELRQARPDVSTLLGDLTGAPRLTNGPYDVIVCMGDTLTHLESRAAVRAAIVGARQLLAPGGQLLLSWRDYTQARRGAARVFLVRGDARRILTCCLEYEAERVEVTDIVHEQGSDGWQMRASSYHKLRLSLPDVEAELSGVGLSLVQAQPGSGWLRLSAQLT